MSSLQNILYTKDLFLFSCSLIIQKHDGTDFLFLASLQLCNIPERRLFTGFI